MPQGQDSLPKRGARWAHDRRFCSAAQQREARPARALPGAARRDAADLPNESCPRGETHFQGQDSFFAIAIARDD